VLEGTSGAADGVLFRERAQEAALEGRLSFGEACWAYPFERGRNRTVVGLRWAFRRSSTRVRDRRCPSQSGWGKSTLASGRRGGCRKGRKARETPSLRKLGRRGPARGVTARRAAACCCIQRRGLDSSQVCSGNTLLQKSVGGMWLRCSGESRHGTWA
jgi:hypothetical protein